MNANELFLATEERVKSPASAATTGDIDASHGAPEKF